MMIEQSNDYRHRLIAIQSRIRSVQIKAALAVQTELLQFYWDLGADIVERQKSSNWGDGFLKQLSTDLMAEFPDMKGFSERNLKYIRQWFLFYRDLHAIRQQVVAQLCAIPWGHNLVIISKSTTVDEALFMSGARSNAVGAGMSWCIRSKAVCTVGKARRSPISRHVCRHFTLIWHGRS